DAHVETPIVNYEVGERSEMTKRQKERKGGRYTPPRRNTIAAAALGVTALVAAGGQLVGVTASALLAGAAVHGSSAAAPGPQGTLLNAADVSPRAVLPNGAPGYWEVAADGGVFAFG